MSLVVGKGLRSSRLAIFVAIVMSTLTVPTSVRALATDASAGPATFGREVDVRLRTLRERLGELAADAAILPSTTTAAATNVVADSGTSLAGFAVRLLLLLLGGWFAYRLFRRWADAWVRRVVEGPLSTARERFTAHVQRLLFAQGTVLSFAGGGCFAYLVFAPPGAAGVIALDTLIAIVAVSATTAIVRFFLAPHAPRVRLVALPTVASRRAQNTITILASVVALGVLWSALLQFKDPASASPAIALTLLACALLAPVGVGIVVTTGGHVPPRPTVVALGIAPLSSWMLAQAGLAIAAWDALALGLAPALSYAVGEAARTVVFGPNRTKRMRHEEKIVSRAARNAGLICALGLVVEGPPGVQADLAASVTREIVAALMILLGTDLAWQIARSLIDRGLAHAGGGAQANRLATVLPALRTILFVGFFVTAILSIASAFGLQIGPLLAGAGVLGLTIGFGAQALVRDVIGGFFLLLDDAFRVGEVISSGGLQGRVEAFSLRSVRLRDDDGHMHTVAFGELKAITNHSRDWSGFEVPIYVRHGVSFDAVAAVIEAAIAAIAADEVTKGVLVAPPKFLGPTALSESSVRLAVLVRTLPGRQGEVRAKLLHHVLTGAASAQLELGTSAYLARPNDKPGDRCDDKDDAADRPQAGYEH